MRFDGTGSVQQAHELAMIIARKRRARRRSMQESSNRKSDSTSVAYRIVYFASIVGFLITCLVASLD